MLEVEVEVEVAVVSSQSSSRAVIVQCGSDRQAERTDWRPQ